MEKRVLKGRRATDRVAEVVMAKKTVRGSAPLVAKEFTMPSLGLLDKLMADDSVNDILVNGTDSIYIDRGGKLLNSGLNFANNQEVWQVAERIMQTIEQTLSYDRPMIDTRLPDGSRVNIIAPPIAVDGVTISIRKFPKAQLTLETMCNTGYITRELSDFLKECVRSRLNIVIVGGASAGKTTLLNALSAAILPDERIVTIEDAAELRLQQPHVVRLESKSERVTDGEKPIAEVTIRDLVRNALRMRPDRIIIGESRGAEAFDMLQAMNTGHDGSMTTLHANSPRDALSRLETMIMVALTNMASHLIRRQISSAVNIVIQMSRSKDGRRHITHVNEVCGMEGEMIVMQDLVTYDEVSKGGPSQYRWCGSSPRHPKIMEAARRSAIIKGLR